MLFLYSLSEIYNLEMKLFVLTVQNLNMTGFEMCVVVVIEFEMISVCVLLQVLDAMEGNLSSYKAALPMIRKVQLTPCVPDV
jgi:hypothetical protein